MFIVHQHLFPWGRKSSILPGGIARPLLTQPRSYQNSLHAVVGFRVQSFEMTEDVVGNTQSELAQNPVMPGSRFGTAFATLNLPSPPSTYRRRTSQRIGWLVLATTCAGNGTSEIRGWRLFNNMAGNHKEFVGSFPVPKEVVKKLPQYWRHVKASCRFKEVDKCGKSREETRREKKREAKGRGDKCSDSCDRYISSRQKVLKVSVFSVRRGSANRL